MAQHARMGLLHLVCFFCLSTQIDAKAEAVKANVLVVYATDPAGQMKQLATAVADGAETTGANIRLLDVVQANYKRDVYEWADAIILGSGVYNGNAAPSLLTFVNSFDFEDRFLNKVGGAFATGGGAVAGLEPVLQELSRSLRTFGVVTVGGASWQNAHGTGSVVNGDQPIANDSQDLTLAKDQGARTAQLALILKQSAPSPTPTPVTDAPPAWGENWTALVSANLTQVGYDAGLVIVNFTGSCSKPAQQKMITVYGDFDTVLTRCDLGREFIIDPPSRGGGCKSRIIGKDVDARICEACSCPFCVRDTEGAFTHGEQFPSKTVWQSKERKLVFGRDVNVWTGVSVSSEKNAGHEYALSTSIAYSTDGESTPLFVNVTHPLWVQTEARIDKFSHTIDDRVFDIPEGCYKSMLDVRTVVV